MNDADFEILQKQIERDVQYDPVLAALSRIERDLQVMLEKVNRLEDATFTPPGGWDDEDDSDLNDPPF